MEPEVTLQQNKTLPATLKVLARAYFAAGIYAIVVGLEFLYNDLFILREASLLPLLFVVPGLIFLATYRGLIKFERWARAFSVFTFGLLILALVYHYQPRLLVPFLALGLFSAAMIVYLRRYKTRELFNALMPSWIKKSINYCLLALFSAGMLFPFAWMLSTSLKETDMLEGIDWFPKKYYIELDGREHKVAIKKQFAEITYLDGEKEGRTEEVRARKVIEVYAAGWYWPWRVGKWSCVIKPDAGRAMPVTVGKRTCDIKIIDQESPRWKEVIKGVEESRLYTRTFLRWKNYPDAYKMINMGMLYFNSLKIVIIVTLGQVFTSSLAGYAFSRLKFPGREQLFFGYLATMMVPAAVTMIPLYILCRKLGLVDTHLAIILPGIFTAYGTFMLRQFFMSIPKDLEEAAKIDGCNLFGIYWRIILPLAKPALATLATFTFMWNWRNFLWPLIVLNSPGKMTIPIGLQAFMSSHGNEWTLLMAGSMMYIMPIMIVFIFNQRFFIKGIQLGAIKG